MGPGLKKTNQTQVHMQNLDLKICDFYAHICIYTYDLGVLEEEGFERRGRKRIMVGKADRPPCFLSYSECNIHTHIHSYPREATPKNQRLLHPWLFSQPSTFPTEGSAARCFRPDTTCLSTNSSIVHSLIHPPTALSTYPLFFLFSLHPSFSPHMVFQLACAFLPTHSISS